MNNTARSSLVGTVAQNLTANVLILVLGFITSVLLARTLGPEGRGTLQAIQQWPLLLIALSMHGLGKAVAYSSAQHPDQAGSYFATGWMLLMVLAIPVSLLGWFLIPLALREHGEATVQAARTFLLLIPIQFAGNLPFWALHGLGKFSTWNTLRSQFGVLWLLVILVAIITGQKTAYFMTDGYLVAMTINCAVWMFSMFKKVCGPFRPQRSRVSDLVRYALPSTFLVLPQQLNVRLDQLLMAVFLPAEVLGLYVVAVAWSNLLSPIMTPISQALFPKVAGMTDGGEAERYGTQVFRISMVVSTALLLAMLIVTPLIFPLLYGKEFVAALPAALILVVASGIKSVAFINAEMLGGLGKPKVPMMAEFIGLAFTLCALFLLLKPFGIMGAAVASLVGYSATCVSSLAFFSRETKTPWRHLFPKREDLGILIGVSQSGLARIAQRVSISSPGAK